MGDGVPDPIHRKQFLWDIDHYRAHFVAHTMHAAEIIGYKHPDQRTQDWWRVFYYDLVKGFHLNPETAEQLDVRLGPTPAEKAMKDLPSPELLAAFQAALDAGKQGFAQHLAQHGYGQADPDDDHTWDAGTGTSHGNRNRSWSGSS